MARKRTLKSLQYAIDDIYGNTKRLQNRDRDIITAQKEASRTYFGGGIRNDDGKSARQDQIIRRHDKGVGLASQYAANMKNTKFYQQILKRNEDLKAAYAKAYQRGDSDEMGRINSQRRELAKVASEHEFPESVYKNGDPNYKGNARNGG